MRSKRSTASATNTKNKVGSNPDFKRWIRLGAPNTELLELNTLLNLYWGGSERRVTGLTLRIIAVNAIALLILMIGILYLGQYQKRTIETRLETFGIELELVASALSEGIEIDIETNRVDYKLAKTMAERMGLSLNQNLLIFDASGMLIAKSTYEGEIQKSKLQSIEVLKKMARVILNLLPDRQVLPAYPNILSVNIADHPDAADALTGQTSLSVWQGEESRVFLAAAAPLYKNGKLLGVIMMTREGHDIEREIARVWIDVLRVFGITLVLTTLLSIYLSGVIARPLKRLARAAEAVRKGKATADDIPDMSHRHDEIGELSLVLKQMTHALWDRMDSIERFAADVSHELKNPLTSLKSAVETAQIVKKKEDREKLMKIIHHDIERLDRLITDISNASRIDSEMSREAFDKIEMKGLLQSLMDAYKDPLDRKKQTIEWQSQATFDGVHITLESSASENVSVMGVESRLMQVFQNILSNALSFSSKDQKIKITVTQNQDTLSVIFQDQGPGIPENKLENVFERFYSERPDHEDYGRHSGLGLSICKQIIEAHGGEITAENAKNASGEIIGARFTVILNLA